MEINAFDRIEVEGQPGLPKIVTVLHRQPTFGCSAKPFRQAKGHLRANAAVALQYPIEGGRGDPELRRKLSARDSIWLQVDVAYELPGMRWVVQADRFFVVFGVLLCRLDTGYLPAAVIDAGPVLYPEIDRPDGQCAASASVPEAVMRRDAGKQRSQSFSSAGVTREAKSFSVISP